MPRLRIRLKTVATGYGKTTHYYYFKFLNTQKNIIGDGEKTKHQQTYYEDRIVKRAAVLRERIERSRHHASEKILEYIVVEPVLH